MKPIVLTITARSNLWTGDIHNKGDKIIVTGIIGSLRWWMEVLVRGLGGFACSPSGDDSCQFDTAKYQKALKEEGSLTTALKAGLDGVCPVCRIFGCNGYKGSIAFSLESSVICTRKIVGNSFSLILNPARVLDDCEKWLFQKTLELISEYGSIGGKTTKKPYTHKDDYGIVAIKSYDLDNRATYANVLEYLNTKKTIPEYPSLRYFWFISGDYLSKDQVNDFLKLRPDGSPIPLRKDEKEFYVFLRGIEGTEKFSKKVFSFKGFDETPADGSANYTRAWGYVRNADELQKITTIITTLMQNDSIQIVSGNEIIDEWR